MAESAAPRSKTAELPAKVAALGERLEALRQAAHEAHLREALSRTELTLALAEALIGRAEALAAAKRRAVERYFARPPAPRPRTAKSRRQDLRLARLGSFGQALVIARSGAWRGTGRRAFDLRHMAAYARRRANPQVQPPSALDQAWYLEAHPDVAATGVSPLVHYLVSGGAERRAFHPLLDVEWYGRRHEAEIEALGLNVLEHFVRLGAPRGEDPHPLFDMAHYAAQAPELAPGEDMIGHYVRVGWREGRSPHPLFDPAWYAAQLPDDQRDRPPLLHYLAGGWREGRSPHPLFDPAWYLEANPDVAAAGHEPLTHFLLSGASEGRSPGPWFDLPHYVARRGAALGGRNALVDYLEGGAWTVSEPRPGFPAFAYLSRHPEAARSGLTPLEHWARTHPR